MLQVYGIKNCNTVKKSLNWLSDHNFEYEFFDVKKNVLSKHLINDWISKMKSNYTWINLINKSGITWKQLSDEIKNGILTSDDAISIILNKPTIMKRPVITKKGKLIAIGFDENLYEGTGIFVLGSVMSVFLQRLVTVNSFIETVICSKQRGELKRWRPVIGKIPIL